MAVTPRVFVSSVVEGFTNYRDAARQGIIDADCDPVLVNEDSPALPASPRNACLDGVGSSDIYLCIVGSRGGSRTLSGLLVTEEEYEHARTLGLPVIVFVVVGNRDSDADAFLQRVSDYVGGQFRVQVHDPSELRQRTAEALRKVATALTLPLVDARVVARALREPQPSIQETILRFVITPERQEEVVDPVRLGEDAFKQLIYRIAHEPDVGLMDYRFAKHDDVGPTALRIEQRGNSPPLDAVQHVWLMLSQSGLVSLDQNVTGTMGRSGSYRTMDTVIETEIIERTTDTAIVFCSELFEAIDPYERHQGFLYNAALWGLAHRTISRSPKNTGGYPVRLTGTEEPIVAFPQPRRITRSRLREPDDEATRVATLLERAAGP